MSFLSKLFGRKKEQEQSTPPEPARQMLQNLEGERESNSTDDSDDLQDIINAVKNGEVSIEKMKGLHEWASDGIAKYEQALNLLNETREENWTYDIYKTAWDIYSGGNVEPDLKPSDWKLLFTEHKLQVRNMLISAIYEARQGFEEIKAAVEAELAKSTPKQKGGLQTVRKEDKQSGEEVASQPISESFETLVKQLGDNDPEARSIAALRLGKIGGVRAVGALVAALKTEKIRFVRSTIAGVLEKLGWQPDKGEAGAAYWTGKGGYHRCVEIGVPAIEVLLYDLNDKFAHNREGVIRALGMIGDERTRKFVTAALNDPDESVRKVAARALETWRLR